MSKTCTRCGIRKQLPDFHKDRTAKDGLQLRCKDCAKIYYETHRKNRLSYSKAYHKAHKKDRTNYQKAHKKELAEWRRSPKGREIRKRADTKYHLKHPERRIALGVVCYVVKIGKLKRSVFCEECGLPAKTEGHHPDYSKPLDVVWLCKKCHEKIKNFTKITIFTGKKVSVG